MQSGAKTRPSDCFGTVVMVLDVLWRLCLCPFVSEETLGKVREAEGREQEGLHGVAGGRAVAQRACLFSMLPALQVRPRKGRGAGGGPGSLRGAEAGGGRGRRSEAQAAVCARAEQVVHAVASHPLFRPASHGGLVWRGWRGGKGGCPAARSHTYQRRAVGPQSRTCLRHPGARVAGTGRPILP